MKLADHNKHRELDIGALGVYTSKILRENLHRSAPRPAVWSVDHFGAALMTDLVGFSNLTERFTKDDKRGAEKIANLLNKHFSYISETIHEHGGDVVASSGDSITAIWPDEASSNSSLVAAVECGLALHSPKSSPDLSDLKQRVAVSWGLISIASLGGYSGRWLTLVSGPAISEVADSFHDVRPGETLLCTSAESRIADACIVERRESRGAVVLGVSDFQGGHADNIPHKENVAGNKQDAHTGCLPNYLPPRLLSRLELPDGLWLPEFRWVTCIFINIRSLLSTKSSDLSSMQTVIFFLQETIHDAGGAIEQLVVEDKGLCMLATFGLPDAAHRDDASRAVGCAVRAHTGIRKLGHEARFGVATGLVYSGVVGGETRKECAVFGPAVNLSARLATCGAPGINCDSTTAESVAERFSFSVLTPRLLRGFEQNTLIFKPAATRSELSPNDQVRPHEGPVIGRDQELELMHQYLDMADESGGVLVLIDGESGIGKSVLVADFLDRAKSNGCLAISAMVPTATHNQPYVIWRPIVERLFQYARDDLQRSQSEALEAVFGHDTALRRYAGLLNDLAPSVVDEPGDAWELSPQTRSIKLKELVATLVRWTASRVSLILVFDDVHLADSAAVSLIEAAAKDVPNLLQIACCRSDPDAGGGEVVTALSSLAFRRIHLHPLDRAETRQLIAQTLAVGDVPMDLADYVFDQCGGHPLYSEEFVRALCGSGRIIVTGKSCELSASRGALRLDAPENIRSAIAARIDGLTTRQQLGLKVASIAEVAVSADVLRTIAPIDMSYSEAQQCLAELSNLELLKLDRQTGIEAYRFKHQIVRWVAYGLLSNEQRSNLHRRALAHLETHSAVERQAEMDALAWHAEQSMEYEKALDYLDRLSRNAIQHYANREAIRIMRRIFSIVDHNSVAVETAHLANWYTRLGDAFQELSEHVEAVDAYERALAAMRVRLPRGRAAAARSIAVDLGVQSWHLLARLGQQAPAAHSRTDGVAHVHFRLSEAAFFRDESLTVLHHTLRGLNRAERCRAVCEVMTGYAALAIGLGVNGLPHLGRFYSRRSIEVAEQHALPAERAYVHLLAAVFAFGQGNWKRVEAHGDKACALFEQLGDGFRFYLARYVQLFGRIVRSDFASAEDLLTLLEQDASVDEYRQPRLWKRTARVLLGSVVSEPDRNSLMALQSEIALELDQSDRMLALGVLALAYDRLGQTFQAKSAADKAINLLQSCPPNVGGGYIFGASGPADIYLSIAEQQPSSDKGWQHLLEQAESACEALARYGRRVPTSRPKVSLMRGRLALLKGSNHAARRHWKRGLRAARNLDMHYDAGILLIWLGRAQRADSFKARLYEDEANRLFKQIGICRPIQAGPPPYSSLLRPKLAKAIDR